MRFEQKSMFHKILSGKKTFGCHQKAEKVSGLKKMELSRGCGVKISLSGLLEK